LAKQLGEKYGYSPETAAAATGKVVEVLRGLSARLEQQRAVGSQFFIGDSLTALDIYWAAFCNTFSPPPPEWCPKTPRHAPLPTHAKTGRVDSVFRELRCTGGRTHRSRSRPRP
jgi:glutathione S-transferase